MTADTDKLFRTIVSSFVHGKLTVGTKEVRHIPPAPAAPRGLGPPGPTVESGALGSRGTLADPV
jgi:hypothetical protein